MLSSLVKALKSKADDFAGDPLKPANGTLFSSSSSSTLEEFNKKWSTRIAQINSARQAAALIKLWVSIMEAREEDEETGCVYVGGQPFITMEKHSNSPRGSERSLPFSGTTATVRNVISMIDAPRASRFVESFVLPFPGHSVLQLPLDRPLHLTFQEALLVPEVPLFEALMDKIGSLSAEEKSKFWKIPSPPTSGFFSPRQQHGSSGGDKVVLSGSSIIDNALTSNEDLVLVCDEEDPWEKMVDEGIATAGSGDSQSSPVASCSSAPAPLWKCVDQLLSMILETSIPSKLRRKLLMVLLSPKIQTGKEMDYSSESNIVKVIASCRADWRSLFFGREVSRCCQFADYLQNNAKEILTSRLMSRTEMADAIIPSDITRSLGRANNMPADASVFYSVTEARHQAKMAAYQRVINLATYIRLCEMLVNEVTDQAHKRSLKRLKDLCEVLDKEIKRLTKARQEFDDEDDVKLEAEKKDQETRILASLEELKQQKGVFMEMREKLELKRKELLAELAQTESKLEEVRTNEVNLSKQLQDQALTLDLLASDLEAKQLSRDTNVKALKESIRDLESVSQIVKELAEAAEPTSPSGRTTANNRMNQTPQISLADKSGAIPPVYAHHSLNPSSESLGSTLWETCIVDYFSVHLLERSLHLRDYLESLIAQYKALFNKLDVDKKGIKAIIANGAADDDVDFKALMSTRQIIARLSQSLDVLSRQIEVAQECLSSFSAKFGESNEKIAEPLQQFRQICVDSRKLIVEETEILGFNSPFQ